MRCPHCQSEQTVKNGTAKLQDQSQQQRYLFREAATDGSMNEQIRPWLG